jgi:beta-lactamase class A
MQSDFEPILSGLGGRAACVAVSMEQNEARTLISLKHDEVFPAASLAKIPILVTLARSLAVPGCEYTWETPMSVPEEARVASDGVLADLSSTLRPTVQDVAHLMITISDNTASNMLLDLVGMETVNETMSELGLANTRLERRFIDFEARRAGRDNWTTAGDMVRLFSHIYSGRVPEHERLISILLRQNDYRILPGYWGEDEPFAHKTGGLEGIMHDAGILFRAADNRQNPLIVAVLTAEQPDLPLTQLTLARVGRALRQEWLMGA